MPNPVHIVRIADRGLAGDGITAPEAAQMRVDLDAALLAQSAWVVAGDGTNQTAALKSALESANGHATRKRVVILGTVLADWHAYADADSAVPTLYAGCTLEGVGYSSVLKGRAATFLDGRDNFLLRRQSNTTIRNLRIDGDAASVGALTQAVGVGIYGKDAGLTGNLVDTVWVHNFAGVTATSAEAFGIMEANPENNGVYRRVRVWDIAAGSGIGLTYGDGAILDDVELWNCDWQGLALYHNTGVQARGVVAHDCGNGLNVEYSEVDLRDCVSYDNDRNLKLLGASTVRAWNLRTWGATGATFPGEIQIAVGDPGTGLEMGQTLVLHSPDVTPTGSTPHINVLATPTATAVRSAPVLVRVIAPDAKDWTITHNNAFGNAALPGMRLDGFRVADPATLGTVATWTKSGASITTPAYSGGDQEGPNAVTLTSTAAWSTVESPYVLTANRWYLIRGRVKVLEAKEWYLYVMGSPNVSILTTPSQSIDVGDWYTFDRVVKTNATGALQWSAGGSATNTLVVDYMIATQIAMQPGMGE